MPMLNEAFYAVLEGVGTPEAIDTVMKGGMNHPMGPLALADFIGLDVCLAILNVLHEGSRRSEVSTVSAAQTDGRCRLSGAEVGTRVLRVRLTRKVTAATGPMSPTSATSARTLVNHAPGR